MEMAELIGAVIAIVGFFGTLALSINAFFLRGIYSKQNEIELKVTTLIVQEEDRTRRIEKLEKNEQEVFKRLNELEKQ